jgi:Secretion system C-terminal sorting domain
MKTIVLFRLFFCIVALGTCVNLNAQSQGLIFDNPTLVSGTNNAVNAVYLFNNIITGVDAKIKVDSLVNGAELKKIDDNTGGLGYLNALQPEIKAPNGTTNAYAVFTVTFYVAGTNTTKMLDQIQGTALDIDGNANLKEYVELGMGGGSATYQAGTIDISVLQILGNKFKGQNILGIERPGIDTTALGNMFTVTKNYITSFTIRFGTNTIGNSSANRQFSLFMKGFTYTNPTTLPIKLKSFDASLKPDNKVELKWVTSAEINVSHFVIEKSSDGINYSDAGLVFAYGNSTEDKTYTFSDNLANTQDAIIYYRLRSVDIDGKNQFSGTRIIKIGKKSETNVTISAYPNPANNELRITLPSNWQSKRVVYELFSANGQTAKRTENANSSQTETMNISNLAPGFYVVRVTCNGETAQQKIIKN